MMTISNDGINSGLTIEEIYELSGGGYAKSTNKYIFSMSDCIRTILVERSYINFYIQKVIYHDPATIILWKDGTKTVVKCDEHDTYDPEKGLYIAIMKKLCGNRGKFYKEAIEPWLPKKEVKE